MAKPLTVRVSVVLTVDPDAWSLAYGTGTDPEVVEADVRSYVESQVQQSAAAEEGGIVAALLVPKRTRTR